MLSGKNLATRRGKRQCRECDRIRHNRKYRPTSSRRRRPHLTDAERGAILEAIASGLSHSRI